MIKTIRQGVIEETTARTVKDVIVTCDACNRQIELGDKIFNINNFHYLNETTPVADTYIACSSKCLHEILNKIELEGIENITIQRKINHYTDYSYSKEIMKKVKNRNE